MQQQILFTQFQLNFPRMAPKKWRYWWFKTSKSSFWRHFVRITSIRTIWTFSLSDTRTSSASSIRSSRFPPAHLCIICPYKSWVSKLNSLGKRGVGVAWNIAATGEGPTALLFALRGFPPFVRPFMGRRIVNCLWIVVVLQLRKKLSCLLLIHTVIESSAQPTAIDAEQSA